MLVLDEKKIRKGKPNFGTDKTIYDVFGGGGAITAECLLNGLDVRYNDLDHTITDMFQLVIGSDREFLKTLLISRDEFLEIRASENKSTVDELKLLVNSFGNNRKGYLYGVEHADLKYNLAKEIIEKHDVFSGYKRTETYKQARRPFDEGKAPKNQVLEQLQQLQQLQQLGQLQQLVRLEQLEVTNLDYKAFSGVESAIFYLDPPYEKTTQEYKGGLFDSQPFYDWAFEMSKKNIVLISSYEISDPRFEVVYEFPSARSTFQGGAGKRHEKLFMVKGE